MSVKVKTLSLIMTVIMIAGLVPVFAFAKEQKAPAAKAPVEVRAKASILMDAATGKVLMAQNEHEKLPPASVTKIMTLLLITEAIDEGKISLSDVVKTSPASASKGGSQIWLKEGETMTVDELLKAIAIGSANDASAAMAEHIAGSEEGFVMMMNERAEELGMKNTNFENCTGLDDDVKNHVTSAYDIAVMSRELISHEFITKYTTVWMDSLRGGETELVNTNKLVRFYDGTTGLKTGTTSKAGHCLSATAKRGNTHLIAVVLGSENSDDRFEGAKSMLNWGFANYSTIQPEIDSSMVTRVNILHGVKKSVMPLIPQVTDLLVQSKRKDDIEQKVNLAVDVQAPIEKGQVLGTIDFLLDGETIASYNLTSPEKIDKLSFGEAVRKLIQSLGI
ncbi:MAG: D-alanyl-D-alanine carboxypeptidase [Oscillospiraceae bacterium]|jgi:D-alanyl-D-alanine carboxypeptidase (penicillin-binding protein 5/6)|nr:D-alanyl-D-alanine carboxypeptidase [Oscillospiraceae bacterium]